MDMLCKRFPGRHFDRHNNNIHALMVISALKPGS